MARCADWLTITRDGPHRAHPPAWAVAGVEARGEWPTLRPLLTVTEAPVLRSDGSVVVEPGYDEATGILFRPSVEFPPVEVRPSRDRCAAAVRALLDVVDDFPFEEPHHRSASLAGTLTVVGRSAFRGPAPLFLHDANVRGAGKSLLVDVNALIATGRPAARMAPDEDDTEMRKRITSVVMAGDRLILIDNVIGALGGASLDAALTGDDWQDRVLGTNTTIRLPLTTVWFASGNNVVLKGDMSRRVAHVRLKSPDEAPEERRNLRIADLRAHVREHRPRLLVEALTILAGYCAAGRPDMDLPPWGGFEAWSALVRNALVWVGEADPAAGRSKLRRACDAEAVALVALVTGWLELVTSLGGPCTVRAALDAIAIPVGEDRHRELRGALAELARVPEHVLGDMPHKVAGVLRRFRDRVVGGRAIVEDGEDRKGATLWGVA